MAFCFGEKIHGGNRVRFHGFCSILVGMSETDTTSGITSFNQIATLRIELKDSDPLIWRELEVPTSITLKVLHDIVRVAMDWFGHHRWEFTLNETRYGLPTDEDWGTSPLRDATKVRLRDILKSGRTCIDYLYDFGDNWEHRLIITDIRKGNSEPGYPRYLAGAHNAPPDDCGGIPGFYAFLDALADSGHPDHAHAVDWAGEYDPEVIEELPMQYALSRIANRRNAAATRLKRKKTGENG